ncbi:manganese-dependent ADP-ribose CDP-alcohol diphosphatase [Brachionus plicatilis]|uniref:Manganese-dependent ADP-ribose CDP-alcohol diphosphatase n=1 Tax=Brachionus plicatilis TaxID=10195 RepID=A0A3M7RYD2_BRAPC|nr:manganese-dependent ADP-ribose CDP-alcohol diphosphatase [Brachionus plicatilis]
MPQDCDPSLVACFGILADVQYADVDDVVKYGRCRYYRGSIQNLQQALQHWQNEPKFSFILQLGDLIDGFRTQNANITDECLEKVLNTFVNNGFPLHQVLNIWGNHELFAFKRSTIAHSVLNTSRMLKQNLDKPSNFYFFDVTDRLRLICLDEYEHSVLGYHEQEAIFVESNKLINDKLLLRLEATDDAHKKYLERFKNWNGGVSDDQLGWLSKQLEYCNNSNKKVLLAGHIPLRAETSDSCAVWNSESILDLIWSYDNLVVAYLAGHYHAGGYFLDKKNIHHLTLNGMLESPVDSNNAFVTVYIYNDRIFFKNQIEERSFSVSY